MKNSLLLTSLVLANAFGAFADVRYTTKTGVSPTFITSTTWVKGKRQRMEMVTDMGTMKTKTVMLTQCDLHQTVTLDPDLKIYYINSFDNASAKPEGGQGTGTITNTYSVKDMGTEKVAQLNAHHWMITTQTKTTGCAGNTDTTSKVEIWTAQIPVLNCPEAANYSQPTCKIKFIENGDVKGMRAAYNGMPVKMITYQGSQQTSVMEFVDYSTDGLADSLFAPPADFKKVTPAEFQQQQQQKMMQQFKVPNQ